MGRQPEQTDFSEFAQPLIRRCTDYESDAQRARRVLFFLALQKGEVQFLTINRKIL
jgi:hypothetical protein